MSHRVVLLSKYHFERLLVLLLLVLLLVFNGKNSRHNFHLLLFCFSIAQAAAAAAAAVDFGFPVHPALACWKPPCTMLSALCITAS